MKEKPRVLIGCPTCGLKEDSLEKYIQGINDLTYAHFDVLIEDNSPTKEYSEKIKAFAQTFEKTHQNQTFRVHYSGQISPKARARLVYGRNFIRNVCLKENYDYFFSLEQDVIPPACAIERLLEAKKEVVSGVYLNEDTSQGQKTIRVMGGYYGNEEERKNKMVRHLGIFQLLPSRVFEAAYAGLGCLLISKKALEKVSFRYEEERQACDDMYFCMDLQEKGTLIYLDSSVLCAHYFNDAFKRTEF
jgi:GT2 family glycosyltransferase